MSKNEKCKECGVGLRNDPNLGLVHPVYARCSFSNRVMATGEIAAAATKKVPKKPSTAATAGPTVTQSGPKIPPKKPSDE